MDPTPEIKIKSDKIKGGEQERAFKRLLFAILIALSIATIYAYTFHRLPGMRTDYLPGMKALRLQFEDNLFRLRHWYYTITPKKDLKPKDIILVAIDEESFKRLGKRWPWGRDVLADFLDKIRKYNPKVIALDFAMFGETPDNPETDIKLADAMQRCGNVIIGAAYGKEKIYIEPYDIFAKASAGYGLLSAMAGDVDNVVRFYNAFALVFLPQKSSDTTTFVIKAAARYLDISYDNIKDERERNKIILASEDKHIEIPTDEYGNILINYLSDEKDIETIPIWRVMADEVPRNIFKNKLVLVGLTSITFHDIHMTPLGYRPGAMVLINVLNSIISQNHLRSANPYVAVPVIAAIYIICFILFYRKQPLKGFFTLIFIMTLCLNVSISLFLKGIMWPAFYSVILLPGLFLGMMFFKYANILIESTEIKRMAITDSLTSLYTHRYFRLLLEHTVSKASQFNNKCSLVVIRILNLDRLVKELSFNRGQMVQKKIAELIKVKLPKNSHGAYLGMGEFGMLMPRVGINEALGIVGSLRNRIKEADFGVPEDVLKPIVAIGVSALNPGAFPKTGIELMRSAKAAMARAKEIGYNRVCRFNPKIDSSVFEPDAVEKGIRQRLDDEFGFIATDLEERGKELEDLLRQLSIAQRDLEQAHFETLRALVVAIEEKDPCTAGHSERVGAYAEKIGIKLRMAEEELRLLKQAGVLHDIGKVGIPPDILRKEQQLTSSERQIIELHPEFSVRILNTSKYFNRILHSIRDHHERLDGSGYPRGLKGNQISLEAQIIAVCDVFDAMTSDRPYRKALSCAESLNEIIAHPEKYNQSVALALKHITEEVKP